MDTGAPPAEEDPPTSIDTSTTVEVTPISDDIRLGIVSYNCKNITSNSFFKKLDPSSAFIFIKDIIIFACIHGVN